MIKWDNDVPIDNIVALGHCTLVQKTIQGLTQDRLEIRPGASNILKLLSRLAPGMALRMTSSSIDDMLAHTQD